MIKILFCCHGNICRSVSGQYILQDMVNRKGLADSFVIDSAATSTEEVGNPIYPPMRKALERKEIPIGNHRARQLVRADFERYDLFIGFDEENIFCMRQILGKESDAKLHYLTEYSDFAETSGHMGVSDVSAEREACWKRREGFVGQGGTGHRGFKDSFGDKRKTRSFRIIDDPWYTREFDQCTEEIVRGCGGLLQYLGTFDGN